MKVKISVIIPAYNAGIYIEQCVKSVLEQTYREFEIIIVDDGSDEISAKIYYAISLSDPRIVLCSQENKGAAAARNIGVKRAEGDYVVFLDADDYWDDKNFLETAVKQIERKKCDILMFGFLNLKNGKYHNPQKKINKKRASGELTVNKRKYILANVYNIISPCSKIIKKEVLDNYKIRFPEGRLHEDIDWAMELINVCKTFEIIDMAPYIRRIRNDSSSKQRTVKDCTDIIWLLEKWTNNADENKCVFYGQLCFQLFILMGMSVDLSEKKMVQREIRKYYWLRKYPNNIKTFLGSIVTSLLPFCICCKIFNVYINR